MTKKITSGTRLTNSSNTLSFPFFAFFFCYGVLSSEDLKPGGSVSLKLFTVEIVVQYYTVRDRFLLLSLNLTWASYLEYSNTVC